MVDVVAVLTWQSRRNPLHGSCWRPVDWVPDLFQLAGHVGWLGCCCPRWPVPASTPPPVVFWKPKRREKTKKKMKKKERENKEWILSIIHQNKWHFKEKKKGDLASGAGQTGHAAIAAVGATAAAGQGRRRWWWLRSRRRVIFFVGQKTLLECSDAAHWLAAAGCTGCRWGGCGGRGGYTRNTPSQTSSRWQRLALEEHFTFTLQLSENQREISSLTCAPNGTRNWDNKGQEKEEESSYQFKVVSFVTGEEKREQAP